ncbi:MAG: enoyl-CoA hydratase/isomerase family protein [Myxococcota bacterium]
MEPTTVVVERRGAVAWIRHASDLDRMDARGLALLRAAVDRVVADDGVRVVVLGGPPGRYPRMMDPEQGQRLAAWAPPWPARWTAAGVRAAVALLRWVWPLRRLLDRPALAEPAAMLNLRAATDALERCDKVTVAAIDGPAFGGGMELALVCDLLLASDRADVHLAQPEVLGGVVAGFGATQRLPRLIGAARALELLLLAEAIRPEQALAWGLVTRVLPADTFQGDVWALAERLARRPAAAVAGTRAAVRAALGGLEPGLSAELVQVLRVWPSPGARKGLAAVSARIAEEAQAATLRPLPELLRDFEQER